MVPDTFFDVIRLVQHNCSHCFAETNTGRYSQAPKNSFYEFIHNSETTNFGKLWSPFVSFFNTKNSKSTLMNFSLVCDKTCSTFFVISLCMICRHFGARHGKCQFLAFLIRLTKNASIRIKTHMLLLQIPTYQLFWTSISYNLLF